MRIKIFEHISKETLAERVNGFLDTLAKSQYVDIKLHVDEQVNPDWEEISPTYFIMVIYNEN